MDTIFALATARGRSGIAVIRVSGDDAVERVAPFVGSVPEARGLRYIRDRQGQILDEALVLRFAGGASFTGEPVVELHVHGSPAVISAVLSAFSEDPLMRDALPGEFTRRALENGRLDLAQVEGLADLIDAETEAQRKQALRVFSGALGTIAEEWRRGLIRAAALIEATIDFADEDVPVDVLPEVREILSEIDAAIATQIKGVGVAERIREGFEVAIVGPPNIGKSTLLNRLAGREAALTSETAGTTRDVIEVRMDLNGLPVTFLDTAGIRETDDAVEKQGVALALRRAEQADIRVLLVECAEGKPPNLYEEDHDIIVIGKSDTKPKSGLGVSGITGQGIDQLIDIIGKYLSTLSSGAGIAIRDRHRCALQSARDFIAAAFAAIDADAGADIVAEDLRRAIRSVDMIVGRVDVEDLLDEIFASFCIGK